MSQHTPTPMRSGGATLEALHIHAIDLLGGWLQRAKIEGWLKFEAGDGARIWPEEVARLLQTRGQAMIDADFSEAVTLTPDACWRRFTARLEDALSADPTARSWCGVIQRAKLRRVEAQMMALLVALSVDQALARAWRYAWADALQTAPSWGFMARLLAPGELWAAVSMTAPQRSVLFTRGLVHVHSDAPEVPLSEQSLVLAPETLSTLLGWVDDASDFCPFEDIAEAPSGALRVLERVGRREATRWAVYGPRGSGRRALIAQLAQRAGVGEGLWTLNLGREVAARRSEEAIASSLRMATMLDVAVVVQGLDRLEDAERVWVERVKRVFDGHDVPLFWMLTAPPAEYFDLAPDAVIGLGYPTREARQHLWREALSNRAVDDAAFSQLAGQYLLSEGQIQEVAAVALVRCPGGGLAEALIEGARVASRMGLGRLATPETGRVSLDQLIVDDETQIAIEEIISYTQNRHRLMSEWGFGDTLSYGLGVTCLFAGPPGTGKTLGAKAIASELGLELFRVDVSQLVSKYIGETEKHLAELFDLAEKSGVMLLFDEADSLFAKRTEVKSSVDRYANLEVNYLLQRIERFEGTTILTTNFEAGLDEAFARRIRFKITFDIPDESGRARIWRALTPDRVPLCESVDFDALAEHFELSGGHIKEVLLRAASVAMNRGERLTQEILLRSANVEYKKIGKLPISINFL